MSETLGATAVDRPVEDEALSAIMAKEFAATLLSGGDPRIFAFALALCDGASVEEAAEKIGVSKNRGYQKIRAPLIEAAGQIFGPEVVKDRTRTGLRGWL